VRCLLVILVSLSPCQSFEILTFEFAMDVRSNSQYIYLKMIFGKLMSNFLHFWYRNVSAKNLSILDRRDCIGDSIAPL
jgi:hypothetical protein